MDRLNLDVNNIIAGNGVTISIMGMLIVFAALAFISLFIAILPKLLPFLEKIFPEQHHHHGPSSTQASDHNKVLAAIGYALYRKKTGTLPEK